MATAKPSGACGRFHCPCYLRDSTRDARRHDGPCSFGAPHIACGVSPDGCVFRAVRDLSDYGSLRLRWLPVLWGEGSALLLERLQFTTGPDSAINAAG